MIKSEASEYPFKEKEYPRLKKMNNTEVVILFSDSGHGVVVAACEEDAWTVGEYSSSWDMSRFKPFHGTVTLTQE